MPILSLTSSRARMSSVAAPALVGQLMARVRLFAANLAALPLAARVWWAFTIALALLTLPWCLSVDQPQPPVLAPVVVVLCNAALVLVTAYRRRRDSLAP